MKRALLAAVLFFVGFSFLPEVNGQCIPPDTILFSNNTPTACQLDWNWPATGTPSSFDIYYSTSPTAPIATSTPTATGITSTTYNLYQLFAYTTYYVWIRSKCGAFTSAWSGSSTFTNLGPCAVPYTLPYMQDCENYSPPSVSDCMGIQFQIGQNSWESKANPYPGSINKVISSLSNTTTIANAWLFTPKLSLTKGITYRLDFDYGSSDTFYTESMKVFFGKNSSDTAMKNLLLNFSSIKTGQLVHSHSTFTVQQSGTYHIGFLACSQPLQGRLNLDNINIDYDNANLLYVSAYFDQNANHVKDISESYVNNVKIKTEKSNGNITLVQSGQNFSTLLLDTGSHIISLIQNANPPYYFTTPVQYIQSYTTSNNIDSLSFAIQPISSKRDLSISLYNGNTIPRPGFFVDYEMLYKNNGTDTADGIIKLVKSNQAGFISSTPAPASVVADTITWNLNGLQPLSSGFIALTLKLKAPPLVSIGDTIRFIANIQSNKPDLTPADNTIQFSQIIRGSFDPNDKNENHGGKLTSTQVANGEYLQYTIRFQNTGNDTAFSVYIRDTLDSKLDYSTLQMLTASHNYQMTMNDGKCVWTFNNINLVDSNMNEPASHGYLVYKIKPRPTVAIGDIFKNTAAIYFDYNLPVMTNTETTAIVADALPLKLLTFSAKKKDKTNVLNWITANELNVESFEVESCSNPNSSPGTGGREFSKIGTIKAGQTQYSFIDEKPATGNTNYYRLKMLDKDGQFTYSPIRMINNNGSFYVNIYPNPVKDALQVLIDFEKPGRLQLQVLSLDGKVLLGNSFRAGEGVSLRSINVSALQKGSYLLKVISGDDVQLLKFEKF